jgi:IS1 family transposase
MKKVMKEIVIFAKWNVNSKMNFKNLKCTYKKFHVEYSKYDDYCAYCGWTPKRLKNG